MLMVFPPVQSTGAVSMCGGGNFSRGVGGHLASAAQLASHNQSLHQHSPDTPANISSIPTSARKLYFMMIDKTDLFLLFNPDCPDPSRTVVTACWMAWIGFQM